MRCDCYARPYSHATSFEQHVRLQEENPHSHFRSVGTWLAEALIETDMGFDAKEWAPIPPCPQGEDYGVTFDDRTYASDTVTSPTSPR